MRALLIEVISDHNHKSILSLPMIGNSQSILESTYELNSQSVPTALTASVDLDLRFSLFRFTSIY